MKSNQWFHKKLVTTNTICVILNEKKMGENSRMHNKNILLIVYNNTAL